MATTAKPVAVSCDGGSPAAHRAAAVAAELAARGFAEPFPADPRPSRLRRRRLIALDGCASACCSRRLESLGLPPSVTVELASLHLDDATPAEVADRVAAAVGASTGAERPTRHRRRAPAPTASAQVRGRHSVRDYLLALDLLAAPVVECGAVAVGMPALAAHVARLLGVSRPSAGEMLARLQADGLIERHSGRQVVLTPAGRAAADEAVFRHRLLERFAGDYLGYAVDECFERARLLDSAFDADTIRRLAAALGEPARCPHGWPLDAGVARVEAAELQTLASLAAGQQAEVVSVEERDPRLLGELLAAGVQPGRTVHRTAVAAAAQRGVLVRVRR